MMYLKLAALATMGFGSGAIIAAGIFAFITIIGVIPRLAQKSNTEKSFKLYEEIILLGGVFGCLASFYELRFPVGDVVIAFFALCSGIFIGCLAVSLAETLDVIPILTRRVHIKKGFEYFIYALVLGKLLGSLLYFLVPGFYS